MKISIPRPKKIMNKNTIYSELIIKCSMSNKPLIKSINSKPQFYLKRKMLKIKGKKGGEKIT